MKYLLLFGALFIIMQSNLSAQLTINSQNWKTASGKDSIALLDLEIINFALGMGDFFDGEEISWEILVDINGMFYDNYYKATNQNFSSSSYYIDSLFDVLAYNRGVYRKDYYKKDEAGLHVLGYEYEAQSYFIGDLTFGPMDSISINNYHKVYDKPFQLYQFPISNGYVHQDSYVRDLNTNITVAGFGLNNALASKRSYVTLKDSVIGWGDLNVKYSTFESGKRDVLVLRRVINIQDSIFLNNQPAPAAFLAAFALEQGAVTTIYRYIILTSNLSSPMMVVTCTDENMNVATSASLNLSVFNPVSSVEDISTNIEIYPNPTQDFINVSVNDTDNYNSIQILNSLGTQVMELNSSVAISHHRIDISKLEAGVYFIKIGNKVEKFIKM